MSIETTALHMKCRLAAAATPLASLVAGWDEKVAASLSTRHCYARERADVEQNVTRKYSKSRTADHFHHLVHTGCLEPMSDKRNNVGAWPDSAT